MFARKFRTALGSAALGVTLAGQLLAADLPPPFEGRLDSVAEASRQVVIDGVTYPLSSTIRVQDQQGKSLTLRPLYTGMLVRATVGQPVPGRAGPSPIVTLTILNN
jgi:hypothetical protein